MMRGEEILNLELDPADNELGATTVREYMAGTLKEYCRLGYRFDGKYAFGGHWERPLVWAFADQGLIGGHWEYDDGERFSFEQADSSQADTLIDRALDRLATP